MHTRIGNRRMKKRSGEFRFHLRSKKGFTLTELIVSIIFVVLIMGSATYAWYASNESFQSTSNTSKAYGQARSLETMLQNAASTTPSLIFTDDPDDPALESGSTYSHFYFDNSGSSPVYKVEYYGNSTVTTPATMDFDAIDEVIVSVISMGRRCQLKYKIASTDENGPFYIEGGIILNNIDQTTFEADNPGVVTLPPVLNFEAPAA